MIRANAAPTDTGRTSPPVTAIAWVSILLLSPISEVVWRAFLGRPQPAWDPFVRTALLIAIVVSVCTLPRFRSLRGFAAVVLAFAIGQQLRVGIESVPPYAPWAQRAPTQNWIFVDSLLGLIPGGLMVLTAVVVSGMKRREMFLAVGDLAAPSGLRWRGRVIRWNVLGPVLLPLITGFLIVQLLFSVGPHPALAGKAVAALPLALVYAIINPIAEEVRYRCVLLGQGLPLFGATQALLMTTVVFAFGHWFGHPSGPTGVVLAGLAGYIWGRSIISTKGIGWAWIIHGVQDLVILLTIAAAP
jgi:uncharacterized protein